MNFWSIIKAAAVFFSHKIARYKIEKEEQAKFVKYGNLTHVWINDSHVSVGKYTYGIPILKNYGGSRKLPWLRLSKDDPHTV